MSEQTLLNNVNEIDAQTLAGGKEKVGGLWLIERRGMWLKGLAVIQEYPHLEEDYDKVGRRKADGKMTIKKLAAVLGRSERTISKWIKLVISVGQTEAEFESWAGPAMLAVQDRWERKLIKSDNERKDSEPDLKKAIEDMAYLSVKERVDSGEETEDDVKWLINRVKTLTNCLKKVMQNLLDDAKEKAIAQIEGMLE